MVPGRSWRADLGRQGRERHPLGNVGPGCTCGNEARSRYKDRCACGRTRALGSSLKKVQSWRRKQINKIRKMLMTIGTSS